MPRTFGKNMRIDTGTNLVSLSASLALLLAPTSKTWNFVIASSKEC